MYVLPGVWVAAVVALDHLVPGGILVTQLLAAAPAIACAGTGRRMCVVLGGLCALLALAPGEADAGGNDIRPRVGTALAIVAVMACSYVLSGRKRRHLVHRLDLARDVAEAAQQVLLRPLPPRIGQLAVAGGYLSATEGARIGGDLYEVLPTPYGVRAVLGDVRGHGLTAIGTVAALLGSFREAAHDEPELSGVLNRLDVALHRHVAQRAGAAHPADGDGDGAAHGADAEEFVTLVLVSLQEDGAFELANCGHPWPFRVTVDSGVETIQPSSSAPPLGLLDLGDVKVDRGELLPGEALLLHTDGAEDVRDRSGAFFPLERAVAEAAGAKTCAAGMEPAAVVATLRSALLAHAGSRLTDDIALLMLQWTASHQPAGQPTAWTPQPAESCPVSADRDS